MKVLNVSSLLVGLGLMLTALVIRTALFVRREATNLTLEGISAIRVTVGTLHLGWGMYVLNGFVLMSIVIIVVI